MNGSCVYTRVAVQMCLLGCDYQTLAEKSGLAYHTLRRRMRGEGTLSLAEAARIRAALGCDMPLEELFRRKEDGACG